MHHSDEEMESGSSSEYESEEEVNEEASEQGSVSEQDWLIDLMESLGYPANPEGVCFGVASSIGVAILTDTAEHFNDRLKYIKNISSDELPKLISDVYKKSADISKQIKNDVLQKLREEKQTNKLLFEYSVEERNVLYDPHNQESSDKFNQQLKEQLKDYYELQYRELTNHLSEQENILLEVLPLFDAIQFYFESYQYPDYFEEGKHPIFQDFLKTSSVLMSKKLAALGGVAYIDTVTGAYEKNENLKLDELQAYFDSLLPYLDAAKLKNNPIFLFTSINHAIVVGYDIKKKEWVSGDANEFLAKFIKQNLELSNKVNRAFSENNTTVVAAQIFSTGQDKEELEKCIKDWKKSKEWGDLHTVDARRVNLRDSDRTSWLLIAAEKNDIVKVKEMLKGKLNLETQEDEINKNDPTMLALKNINLNEVDEEGNTALMLAAKCGNFEIVNLLIKAGADKYIQNKQGFTAFSLAVKNGFTEIVQLLLDEKLINIVDKAGHQPLAFSVLYNHMPAFNFLLDKSNVNHQSKNQSTTLYLAAAQGNLIMLDLLMQRGADLNLARDDGMTPFLVAAKNGHMNVVNFLLNYSPDLKASAAMNVQFLIEDAEDKDKSCKKSVTKLFKQGRVLPKEIKSFNALHLAAFHGHAEVVDLLLRQGLSAKSVTENGLTPLDLARATNQINTMKVLISHEMEESKKYFPNDALVNLMQKELMTPNNEGLNKVYETFMYLKKLNDNGHYLVNYQDILRGFSEKYITNKEEVFNALRKIVTQLEDAKKAHQQQGLHQQSPLSGKEEHQSKKFKKDK